MIAETQSVTLLIKFTPLQSKTRSNTMDNQALQEAIKSDLLTIPTLKIGILSSRDLYGSLAAVMLKTSLIFLGINTVVRILLHALGLHDITLSISSIFCTWGFAFGASMFIGMILSQYILFGKLVKGRLKTEAFIKRKCAHFSFIYFVMYAVVYAIMTAGLGAAGQFGGHDHLLFWDVIFPLGFAQLMSLVVSLVGLSFLTSMEIQRLGLGAVFDVINQFVAKLKNYSLRDLNTHNGSHN